MLEEKTVVDQIEITRDGTMQIRLGLLIVKNGVQQSCDWHRTSVAPGVSVDLQMEVCNKHLVQMERLPVGPEEVKRLSDIAQLIHTPAVIEAHQKAVRDAPLNRLRGVGQPQAERK